MWKIFIGVDIGAMTHGTQSNCVPKETFKGHDVTQTDKIYIRRSTVLI